MFKLPKTGIESLLTDALKILSRSRQTVIDKADYLELGEYNSLIAQNADNNRKKHYLQLLVSFKSQHAPDSTNYRALSALEANFQSYLIFPETWYKTEKFED